MSTGPTKRTADEAGMDMDNDGVSGSIIPNEQTPVSSSFTTVTTTTASTSGGGQPPSTTESTVASLSSSSTATEDNEVTRQRAELKTELERIETERQALMAGTHGIYLERCAVFESVRAESIAKAVAQRQYQLESIERMFEYQKYAADKICENNKNEVSSTLLKELTEKAEIINAKLLGQNEPRTSGEPRIQRTLRSKRTKAEETTSGTGGGLSTGLGSTGPGTSSNTGLTTIYEHPPPVLSIPLPSNEAIADMKVIYRDWKAVAQKWRQVNATALLPTRVELNKLYYINDEFNRGDPVIVFSELTKEEFYGHLHLLSAIEVIVKLGSGSRIRIPLQHLRHGRVSLYKYAIGQGPNGGRIPPLDNPNTTGDNTTIITVSSTTAATDGTGTSNARKQNRTGGNRSTNDNVRRAANVPTQGQALPPHNPTVPGGAYVPPPSTGLSGVPNPPITQ